MLESEGMEPRILVAHAAWSPGRAESLARLVKTVDPDVIFRSRTKEPVHVFAKRVWEDIARNGDAIYLEDDVIAHPQIRKIVQAQAKALPYDAFISLHASYPDVRIHAEAGHNWVRSFYMTGPAHFFTQAKAQAFLKWVDECPQGWAKVSYGDGLACYWLYWIHEPAWLSLPAIVRHDVQIKSTFGHDGIPNRTTLAPWDDDMYANARLTDPAYWRPDTKTLYHVECPWLPVEHLEECRKELVIFRKEVARRKKASFLERLGIVHPRECACGACVIEDRPK